MVDKMKVPLIEQIRNGLVVSCQAPHGSPLANSGILAAIAQAAEDSGAVAIRAEGLTNIRAIRRIVKIPIIGLVKRWDDSDIYITPEISDVLAISEAGADIVALDGTDRVRKGGVSAFDFIMAAKSVTMQSLIMADIDDLKSALTAQEAGADLVGTTLSGYTIDEVPEGPDLDLVKELSIKLKIPVIAEGRYSSPSQVKEALQKGALAVCVGTAITDPWTVTRRYVKAIK